MMRVSPPEEDRELPGPQASSRVTCAPRRSRCKAVHPPKAPAPITAMWGFGCMLMMLKDSVLSHNVVDSFGGLDKVASSGLKPMLGELFGTAESPFKAVSIREFLT